MISLADLAALHDRYRDDLTLPVQPVRVGDLVIGDEHPVLMGVVNLSRDSFYLDSVATSGGSAVRKARVQIANGAGIVDLGAESSVDGTGRVAARDQVATLVPVVEALAAETVVSVETYEPSVVRACLRAGVRVLNMTGRDHEEAMLELAAEHDAVVVMCYGEVGNVREVARLPVGSDLAPYLVDHFGPRLERAEALGATRVLVDPGLGFTYSNMVDPMTRVEHQARALLQSFRLRALGRPVCQALPMAFDLFEEQYGTAESFFAVLARLGGAHLLRTHEVPRLRPVLAALSALSALP